MSCLKPQLAVILGSNKEGAERKIKFIRRSDWSYSYVVSRYGLENVLLLPCGKCPECKKRYRRDWSIRCMAEASCHKDNCFITLTYDELHYKHHDIDDLQKFFKRLRSYLGVERIKYFACHEAGGQTGRWHWHAVIFGWFPSDAKVDYINPLGQRLYKSAILERLWPFGFCNVAEVSKDTCSYVAGYTAKKENPIFPGKLFMSRRPGLGYQFFKANGKKILHSGSCVIPGFGVVPVPRYGLDVIAAEGYDITTIKDDKFRLAHIKLVNDCIDNSYLEIDQAIYQVPTSVLSSRKRGL